MQRRIFTMAAVLVLLANAASAKPRHDTVTPSPSPSPSATPDAVASPSPEPTSTAASRANIARGLPVDGAFTLPGIWNCETLANSSAKSVYKLVDRKHMIESTTLHLPNRPVVVLESTFAFDAAKNRWKLSMQKGAYVAHAPAWSDATWTFEGIESDADPHRLVRLVYTSLGPDAYRSDYQAQNRGVWQTFSGATCKRYVP